MALHFLYKLQRQPLRVRKQFAFLFSAGMTGIIVILWLVGASASEFSSGAVADTSTKETGPFKALTEGLGIFWNDTTKAFQGVAGAFSSLAERPSSTTRAESNETFSE